MACQFLSRVFIKFCCKNIEGGLSGCRDCMIVHRKCQIILHERNLQINAKEDLFPISPISQLSPDYSPPPRPHNNER